MNQQFVNRIKKELEEIESAGLYKRERIITSDQGPEIDVNGNTVLNFCGKTFIKNWKIKYPIF
jgi:glycine C-acetyltransferase